MCFAPRSTLCAVCGPGATKNASVLWATCPQGRKREAPVVPPWFAAPLAGNSLDAAAEDLLTAGRCNGRSRRRLSTLALRPRSSETIFSSLFPALFHQPGSLERSMRKLTLLITAIFVILHLF